MAASLEMILRYGCSVEAAEVYDAVRRLCECKQRSRRLGLIEDLERAYHACEAAHANVESEIEAYKGSNGKPAAPTSGWKSG